MIAMKVTVRAPYVKKYECVVSVESVHRLSQVSRAFY